MLKHLTFKVQTTEMQTLAEVTQDSEQSVQELVQIQGVPLVPTPYSPSPLFFPSFFNVLIDERQR